MLYRDAVLKAADLVDKWMKENGVRTLSASGRMRAALIEDIADLLIRETP